MKPHTTDTPAVSSNPGIRGGELCIHGTRLPIHIIVRRHLAGDSVRALARDYDKDEKRIREALVWASERVPKIRVQKRDVAR